MESVISQQERKDKRKGMTTSIIVHILLILLALWPLLTFPDPPPGQEGILVNLGIPDVGQGEENAGPAEPAVAEEAAEPEETVEEEEEEPEPEPEPKKEEKKPEPAKEKEVVKTEDPNEVALRKKKREEERKKQEEAERKKREDAKRKAEAEKKRKAAEAKAKAEAERKKRESDAKDFGKSLGLEGLGKGKGNTGKAGNQGDPDGDPSSSKLEGISTGSGRVGGGLGSRGVVRSPKATDNSQEQGTVVVKVCVDGNGKVLSAEFTQRGSTATSSRLKQIALSNAKKWRFSKGAVDKQCGTITYNFKVK